MARVQIISIGRNAGAKCISPNISIWNHDPTCSMCAGWYDTPSTISPRVSGEQCSLDLTSTVGSIAWTVSSMLGMSWSASIVFESNATSSLFCIRLLVLSVAALCRLDTLRLVDDVVGVKVFLKGKQQRSNTRSPTTKPTTKPTTGRKGLYGRTHTAAPIPATIRPHVASK